MKKYICCDDGGEAVEIEATSAEEAAREYIDGCELDFDGQAERIEVGVTDEDGDFDRIPVEIAPDHWLLIERVMGERGCGHDPDWHDWTSDGGGTTIEFAAHCSVCGLRRNQGQADRVEYSPPLPRGERRYTLDGEDD